MTYGDQWTVLCATVFVNMGKEDIITDSQNGWEVYTKDHMPSAQWEIMVLVTEEGNEVLCW